MTWPFTTVSIDYSIIEARITGRMYGSRIDLSHGSITAHVDYGHLAAVVQAKRSQGEPINAVPLITMVRRTHV
jgi:hypothetical protein